MSSSQLNIDMESVVLDSAKRILLSLFQPIQIRSNAGVDGYKLYLKIATMCKYSRVFLQEVTSRQTKISDKRVVKI